jgi:hypothetical protein
LVGSVLKIYPGRRRTTVLVEDQFDGQVKRCWVSMTDELGPWLASLCARATEPLVLTLRPPDPVKGSEIVDAERLENSNVSVA